MTIDERFWVKVDKAGPWSLWHRAPGQCWVWTAATTEGYGRFHLTGRTLVLAHRFSYETTVGPVPDGLDLDHVCRRRICINPAHLEPVTRQINLLRGDTLTRAHHEDRDCGFFGCNNCQRFQIAA